MRTLDDFAAAFRREFESRRVVVLASPAYASRPAETRQVNLYVSNAPYALLEFQKREDRVTLTYCYRSALPYPDDLRRLARADVELHGDLTRTLTSGRMPDRELAAQIRMTIATLEAGKGPIYD